MPGRRRSTRYYDFEDDHGEDTSNVHSESHDDEDQQLSIGQQEGKISNGDGGFPRVASGWPRRLLHVGTMTSYARSGSGDTVTYGNINNPEFNVMSYTWGRFEDSNGEAVRINNVQWPIPKIRPDVFTAAEFRRALHEAAGDRDFLWVDIACIDQNSGAEKSEEVGNQAAIFHRAKEVVIWLHGLRTRTIERAIDNMVRTVGEAQQSETITQSGDEDTKIMVSILKDPWFSSMWTLQEASLRKNATIMSKEAEVVEPHSLRDTMTLDHIIKICTMLYEHSSRLVQDAINLAGLRELDTSNPMVLLSAARRRITTRPADRIYGIMQAFDVKIGNTVPGAVDPIQYFSLPDLESQLSAQINSSLPTIAQLFVHLKEPRFGKAWGVAPGIALADRNSDSAGTRMGSNLAFCIPPEFFNALQINRECQISYSEGRPYFEGTAWRLETLVDKWVKDEGSQKPAQGVTHPEEKTADMNTFSRSIFMDQTSVFVDTAGNTPPNLTSKAKPVAIGVDLVKKYPGKFFILVLGEIQDEESGNETSVGVLVRNEGRSKDGSYRRVGFCTWQGKAVDGTDHRCHLG